MKRYIYLLPILCLLTANSVLAADGERSLVVLLKSGTMVSLPVSEQPKIVFDGTVMRVGNGDYQIENVRKWMIGNPEEIAQGVAEVKADGTVTYRNGVLTIGNRTDVQVYNSAGIKMPAGVRNGQIDMSAWPADIYVIKAGNETLKLRNR